MASRGAPSSGGGKRRRAEHATLFRSVGRCVAKMPAEERAKVLRLMARVRQQVAREDDAPEAEAVAVAVADDILWLENLVETRRRERREAKEAPFHRPGWSNGEAAYPAGQTIPVDADGFAVSFDPEDARDVVRAQEHLRLHGYVVFRDVVSPAECEATLDEMWDWLERRPECAGLTRSDPSTWDAWKASKTYGLAPEPVLFTPQLVRNRQAKRLVCALAAALEAGDAEAGHALGGSHGMVISQDRWCLYRPTRNVPVPVHVCGGGAGGGGAGERGDVEEAPQEICFRDFPEWRTRSNLHLDVNPWCYVAGHRGVEDLGFDALREFPVELNRATSAGGPHIQGVLSLIDNRVEDGGTVLIPGFHRCFDAWVRALRPSGGDPAVWNPATDDPCQAAARFDRGATMEEVWGTDRSWLVGRRGPGGSWKFADGDPARALARRVPVRAGCLLVWDQRVAHGAAANSSDRPRAAQFVRAFRRMPATQARLVARAKLVLAGLREAGTVDDVTEEGWQLFGLDVLGPRGESLDRA